MAHLCQHATCNDQAHNSEKLRNSLMITVDISQEELNWVQEIISLMNMGEIQLIPRSRGDSTSHDLSMAKRSGDSIIPNARSEEAIIKERITSKLSYMYLKI